MEIQNNFAYCVINFFPFYKRNCLKKKFEFSQVIFKFLFIIYYFKMKFNNLLFNVAFNHLLTVTAVISFYLLLKLEYL